MQRQEFFNRWLEIIKRSSALQVYKHDFVNRLLEAIKNCATRHTYDMAWVRALVEVVGEEKISLNAGETEVDLRPAAAKIVKYYWDQTVFFGLLQGSNPCKQPDLICRVGELFKDYSKKRRPAETVLFEKANFSPRLKEKLTGHIDAACEILKNDVVSRFLARGRMGDFIKYSRGDNSLILPHNTVSAIEENSSLIVEAVYNRWAQILEKYNTSPRLHKKIRIIDAAELRERPLSFYTKYLDIENPGRLCFLCGQPVKDQDLSINHVIPWSYLCSDDIWNLVYMHKSCSSAGPGPVPPEIFIARLEKRNRALLDKLISYVETDMIAGMLQDAVNRSLVRKNWICCK
ncbi:MAG: HNH endonuclease [Firmicutes bacterium]|nr:HNH endonuclease [Bacillota bacterium]